MRSKKTKISFDKHEFLTRFCRLSRSDLSQRFLSTGEIGVFNPYRYGRDDYKNFQNDYFLTEIFRKFHDVDKPKSSSLLTKAVEVFIDNERHCDNVNRRLWDISGANSTGEAAIHAARLKLLRLLGSDIDYNFVELCGFSSGASFDMKLRDGTTAGHKFGHAAPTVTVGCLKYAEAYLSLSPHWRGNVSEYQIVKGNRITTVPKNNEIDRPIAIEPTLNMFFQKGVGRFLRNKLKIVGIDLNDQSINRRLAREGSIKGNLATIDLQSASDTVSLAICELLLPPAWYNLLLDLRSPFGILPNGDEIEYSKMSSMGNGFTFELESLIFWALSSTCSSFVSVYGDDIVVPVADSDAVIEVLQYAGFIINHDKTFKLGHFRESCGGHYFNGNEVTPVYHRLDGINRPDSISRLILFANNLRRWIGYTYQPKFFKLLRWLIAHLPDRWRQPSIPDGVGDGALIGTLAEISNNDRVKTRHGTFICPVLIKTPLTRWENDLGAYLARLHEDVFPRHGPSTYEETPSSHKYAIKQVLLVCGWSDPIL